MDFKLPDVGEGIAEGVLVKWHVAVGDAVKTDDVLCEVETDKAVVEIPSPTTGKITELKWKEGDTVPVGDVLVVFDGGSAPATPEPVKESVPAPAASSAPKENQSTQNSAPHRVLATPYTRRLAREKGVDISKVPGTGPAGRVTAQDIEGFASGGTPAPETPMAVPNREDMVPEIPDETASAAPAAPVASAPAQSAPPAYTPMSVASHGQDKRVPMTHLRQVIAKNLSTSVHTIAQATHMDSADITELVKVRGRMKEKAAENGVKLTYLPFITKALVNALRKFPHFNSSLDEAKQELVVHGDYNIGYAVDTPDGLVVPVVKGCDVKSMYDIAGELQFLSGQARNKKLTPGDMQGGTFTITNIGSLGGEYFVPIVNYPQVAILGVCRMKDETVVENRLVTTRKKLNLVLSYDHRVVDGADVARFMNEIIAQLSDPDYMLLRS